MSWFLYCHVRLRAIENLSPRLVLVLWLFNSRLELGLVSLLDVGDIEGSVVVVEGSEYSTSSESRRRSYWSPFD